MYKIDIPTKNSYVPFFFFLWPESYIKSVPAQAQSTKDIISLIFLLQLIMVGRYLCKQGRVTVRSEIRAD